MRKYILVASIIACLQSEASAQIKSFKQLHKLTTENNVSAMKQILKFEGYTYENTGEVFPKVNCEMWSLLTSSGKTAFGFVTIGSKGNFPSYMFIDTSYQFMQRMLVDLEYMGYRHPEKDAPELYTHGDEFLIMMKASYGMAYMFGRHYEQWIKAIQIVSAADKYEKIHSK